MSQTEQIRKSILGMVKATVEQRQSPNEVMDRLAAEFGVSMSRVREALNDLIREGELVFTYRRPFTYVEIPYERKPRGSRPMKVITDTEGNPWICDYDVDPSGDLAAQGCWQLKEGDSTRNQ
jgi:DNA-binding FadR family transcriptional regulator